MNHEHAHAAHQNTPDTSLLTTEQMQARITELEQAVERLTAQPSLFQDVMQASAAYVTRFGGRMTYTGALRKADEEHREYLEAIGEIVEGQPASFILSKPETLRKAAAEELIDALVTLGGLASLAGLTWADIEQAARETLLKLDNRTPETHAWNPETKTVERIGRTQS
jgi:uncharacterized small protein (DUF1192 family)